KVLAVDRVAAAADETREIIRGEGGTCETAIADVSLASDVADLVETCLGAFGRVDILHNNVGISSQGGPEDISEEEWDRVFDVNVKGMFLTCRHVLPVMVRQGSGAIVNVSSINSIRDTGLFQLAYNASKGAVNQLTQSV